MSVDFYASAGKLGGINMTDYEKYLERYCKSRGISKEEADEHAVVKEVKKQYESNDSSVKAVGWKENDA